MGYIKSNLIMVSYEIYMKEKKELHPRVEKERNWDENKRKKSYKINTVQS